MKNNSLLIKAWALAVSSVVMVSCEVMDDYMHVDSSVIKFGVDADADGAPSTRATQYADSPVVMLGEGGSDTLYLHASIDVNTATVSKEAKAGTRGVPINSGNFQAECKNFGVTAYTQGDGKLFMSDEEVSNYANEAWSPSGGARYWPEDETLDFYAYAPYSFKDNKQFDNGALTIDKTDHTMSFSYTVPTTTDGNDAVAQPDIMFAYAACSRSTTNERGNVPLEFAHALAGVKFVASDIAGCTINSITLKGLYGKGDCTFTPASEEGAGEENPSVTFTWSNLGDKKDFTQAFGVELNDQQSGEQQITKKPETTFMMLPQELNDATIEINLTTKDDKQHTLVGKLASNNLTAWEAGKIYTYKISSESINWTYVFEVTPSITLPLGGTSSTYNVVSYRYRTQNPSVKEAVAWNVTSKSGTETEYQTPGNPVLPIEADAMSEVLTTFTDNDKGGGEDFAKGIDYPIVVARTKLVTDWPGDGDLRAATPKGSASNPYDLSTEGGTLSQTTANCYVVNAPGTYKLPLVYGNAIVEDNVNDGAYNKDNKFVDYKGQHITSPYLPTPDDATLVWSDGFYMFKDVRLSADKKYLIFTIDPDYIQQANAVVAVRDAGDNIMWSWHIWVTEHKINETIDYQAYENASTIYSIMPCNLGWVDGKMVFYNPRELDFVFTQDKTGTQKPMKLTQAGAKLDYRDIGSTYYQWGRKDPIVALKNRNETGVEDYRPMETPEEKYQYKVVPGGVSMATAIQNPNIYYVQPNSESNYWLSSSSFTVKLWDGDTRDYGELDEIASTKTVYDPSPRGFKVPFPRVFAGFVNGGTASTSGGTLNGYIDSKESFKYHVYYTTPDGKKKETVFTATGQRSSDKNFGTGAGSLWALDRVYYWTCNPQSFGISYSLVICNDSEVSLYSYAFLGRQVMARPVRCMKE